MEEDNIQAVSAQYCKDIDMMQVIIEGLNPICENENGLRDVMHFEYYDTDMKDVEELIKTEGNGESWDTWINDLTGHTVQIKSRYENFVLIDAVKICSEIEYKG